MKLVHTIFKSGERYSLLVGENGLPLWYPALYVTSQLRNAARAPNTIVANLAVIRQVLVWSKAEKFNLEANFSQGQFLTTHQVESLCRFLQQRDFRDQSNVQPLQLARNKEAVRAKASRISYVSSSTLYIRLSYAADYLKWLASRVIEESRRDIDVDTMSAIKRMVASIRSRRPNRANSLNRNRMGLSKNQRIELLELVDPNYAENPFSDELKVRNELIVHLLYDLGLRQGELLSIRIKDVDVVGHEIEIPRRHDDPDDPRRNQPVAKTMDRKLPLSKDLADLIANYIFGLRRAIKPARKHDFLLVVHKKGPYLGQPLSSRGLAKILKQIQDARPNTLGALTPHVLRHTWNDRFSELADEKGLTEAKEEKMRSYSMGWKEGSGTSAIYTRRHVEREAKKVALELQNKLKGANTDD